jgi:hypothetical protein
MMDVIHRLQSAAETVYVYADNHFQARQWIQPANCANF